MDIAWFKQRMREKRVTQEALADAIGRHRSVVSKILTGRQSLELFQVEPFARLLEVPPQEILRRAGLDIAPEPVTTGETAAPFENALARNPRARLMAEIVMALRQVLGSEIAEQDLVMLAFDEYTELQRVAGGDAERRRYLEHAVHLLKACRALEASRSHKA